MLNHTGIGEGTYLPANRGRWTRLLVGEGEVLDDDGDHATMAWLLHSDLHGDAQDISLDAGQGRFTIKRRVC